MTGPRRCWIVIVRPFSWSTQSSSGVASLGMLRLLRIALELWEQARRLRLDEGQLLVGESERLVGVLEVVLAIALLALLLAQSAILAGAVHGLVIGFTEGRLNRVFGLPGSGTRQASGGRCCFSCGFPTDQPGHGLPRFATVGMPRMY